MVVPRRHQIEPLADQHRRPGVASELLPISGLFLAKLGPKLRETTHQRGGILTRVEERPQPRFFFRDTDGPAFVKLGNQQILCVR